MADKIKVSARKVPAKRKALKVEADTIPATKSTETPRDPQLAATPAEADLNDRKYILNPPKSPETHQPPSYDYLGEIPDSYGTKKLFLVARDPYYLFAYWDLTWQQFQEAARSAQDHKVFLQLYLQNGDRIQQLQINEGARSWTLHVPRADTTFYAELGYYRDNGKFEVISRSGEATTPRDTVSWKTETRFVTIPFHFTFRQLFEIVANHMLPGEDLAETMARLQESGFEFPFPTGRVRMPSKKEEQELLDYLTGGDGSWMRKIQMGSLEITEFFRRRFQESLSSGQWTSSLSSPFGASFGFKKEREFHMHVNAELIIYGGTDPKAKVRIDGEEIALRKDGTFSYHFTFPDGSFHIPVEATSPDGVEMRSALLSFLRMSEYTGDVRKTGQAELDEPLGRED